MKSNSDLYRDLLLPKGHGYPLFQPQPSDSLPDKYKEIGTRIGDVGFVKQGSFKPIFNILHESGDRDINRFGVPDHFERVELVGDDHHAIDWREPCHPPGSDISSTHIGKRRVSANAGVEDNNVFLPVVAGAEVEISTDSEENAILVLPDGASSWDLFTSEQLFKDYAEKHARNWYKFVNARLGMRIATGDLYLVTGVTKSSSWSVAAYGRRSADNRLSLKLKASAVASAGASYAWSWEQTSSDGCHSGPRGNQALMNWKNNQTVFLRGYKIDLPLLARRGKAIVVPTGGMGSERGIPYSNNFASRGETTGTAPSNSHIQNASSGRSPVEGADLPSDSVDSLDTVATASAHLPSILQLICPPGIPSISRNQ
ncbi:hypothetical protein B0H19DRAFT_1332592 [Mycena capillaripes]|nr:hypothetical protein B0H19DRAFT_1332592 [Mycena capillaripes]